MECYDDDDVSCSEESFEIDIEYHRKKDLIDEDEEPDNSEDACRQKNRGIRSYQFEPLAEEEDGPEENVTARYGTSHVTEPETRLLNKDWCMCRYCEIMPTVRENVCCHEIKAVMDEMEEEVKFSDMSGKTCIIEHPGFPDVCLNRHVLKAAYLAYRQDYGTDMEDTEERRRYTSYRQFVRWIWGYLGKNIRVVLPSCAVAAIRRQFPSEDSIYIGFQFPEE